MSVWLITGGAGFIGSNFVRRLSAAPPARLVILDALTYAGNLATISDLVDGERILFVHGDVRDAAVVRDVFARHEVERVVHFAAESHVDRSIAGPRAFIETNVTGTLNLLDAARERWRGAGGRRCFLHVSTDEVYGTLSPTDPPFREGTPYAPNSPYAASKAAADHQLLEQLRAVAISREADPAHDSQRRRRARAAGVRRRPADSRLAARAGSLRRAARGARSRHARPDLLHRRQ
jgi:dTDP-glucose 4,6-dehydratase